MELNSIWYQELCLFDCDIKVRWWNIIKYWAIDTKGKKIKGKCEDSAFTRLKYTLRKKEYFIYQTISLQSYKKIFLKNPGPMDISVLCSQLSVMLGAGINISRVLDNLETQCNKSSLRLALKSIKEDVIKGQSIHSSMAKFKNIFLILWLKW